MGLVNTVTHPAAALEEVEEGEIEEGLVNTVASPDHSLLTQLARAQRELKWFREQEVNSHRSQTAINLAYRGPVVGRSPMIESDGSKKVEKAVQLSVTAYNRILRYLYVLKDEHQLETFSADVHEGNAPFPYYDWVGQEWAEISWRKAIPNDMVLIPGRDLIFFSTLVNALDAVDDEVAELWSGYQPETEQSPALYPLDALIRVLHTAQAEAAAAGIQWDVEMPV